ncbi:Proline iminopeptidase [Penicillium canariense]|uniref:Proline iminopeptidase n=1 Tax=Penicillium canariense TaxID=189055 RepID=A0A9W9I751_9EURO|nr:Proline iminopeptidase [Penicillium canariense]KAJ5168196.1 Proline iminopeptidase [Penicillium canariense]
MSGYEHSDPFDAGKLLVGSIHQLHYEQYGKPDGKPIVYLHGGPGGHTRRSNTSYFNPDIYRVVLLDQRGTGKSQPAPDIRENTTPELVSDIEALRVHLGIPRWHLVYGGSWGSTLALLYAQTYPEMVGSLIVWGVFTTRKSEVDWSRGHVGAPSVFPEAFEAFVNHLSPEERGDLTGSYYKRLTSGDHATRVAAAREWNRWDLSIGSLKIDEVDFQQLDDEGWSLPHAVLEAHYSVHDFWLEDGQILKAENLAKIQHIPVTIIQGRYDMVCPPQTAWELHKALPKSRLIWIPDAGHTPQEPGTRAKLLEACDNHASQEF